MGNTFGHCLAWCLFEMCTAVFFLLEKRLIIPFSFSLVSWSRQNPKMTWDKGRIAQTVGKTPKIVGGLF